MIIHDNPCFPFPSLFSGAFYCFLKRLRCGHDMDGHLKLNPLVLVFYYYKIPKKCAHYSKHCCK